MLENFPIEYDIPVSMGKHDRWLGFVQGALWAMDIKDIDTFRKDVTDGQAFERLCEYLSEL